MNPDHLFSLAPLAAMALGAVVAMVLAPTAKASTVRAATAGFLALALMLVAARFGAPEAAASPLLADDGLARFGAGLAALAGLGVLAFARPPALAAESAALIALAAAGAGAAAAADHAATLFLGLEITTLSMIAMTVMPGGATALEAGYKLFLMAGAGAAALLLGIAYGFMASGVLTLDAWSPAGAIAAAGAALLIAGLAFKFSLPPFHMWLPDLFSGAPPAAAAIAGTLSKIAAAAALVRIAGHAPSDPVWSVGLAATGAAAALLGNLIALRQHSLIRLIGYSSIAHSGYMALIVAAGGDLAGEAVPFYLGTYAPAMIAALCALAVLGPRDDIGTLSGLFWRRPFVGACLGAALLSMAGLPPTAGFMAKIYLFAALSSAGAWPLLAAAIAGTAIAFYFYMRFAIRLFSKSETAEAAPQAVAGPERLALAGSVGLILLIGVYPEPLMALARAAAP